MMEAVQGCGKTNEANKTTSHLVFNTYSPHNVHKNSNGPVTAYEFGELNVKEPK